MEQKITFSAGNVKPQILSISGGNADKLTVHIKQPKMLVFTHYPNIILESDPAIEQRIIDLEAHNHFNNIVSPNLNQAQTDYINS